MPLRRRRAPRDPYICRSSCAAVPRCSRLPPIASSRCPTPTPSLPPARSSLRSTRRPTSATLSPDQLPQVCRELREYIIDVVAVHGGHFGASLGVVELTVAAALGVRHAARPLGLGRGAPGVRTQDSDRPPRGLPDEPEVRRPLRLPQAVGVRVRHLRRRPRQHVDLGRARDGEGARHRRQRRAHRRRHRRRSDDGRPRLRGAQQRRARRRPTSSSSSTTTGCPSTRTWARCNEYLASIASGKAWNTLRDDIWDLFERMKGVGGGTLQKIAARVEDGLKATITPGMLFEALGFRYFGPVDGHDVEGLVERLKDIRKNSRGRSCCIRSRSKARASPPPRPTRSSGTPRARPSTKSRARASPSPRRTGKNRRSGRTCSATR